MQYQDQVTVDDQSYLIVQFSPTKSLKLLIRLAKMAGPAVGRLIGEGEALKGDNVEAIIGEIVAALTMNLDEHSTLETIKEILSAVNLENEPVTKKFETHFQGKIGLIFKLCAASLKVQYGDFSAALGQLAAVGILRPRTQP